MYNPAKANYIILFDDKIFVIIKLKYLFIFILLSGSAITKVGLLLPK